MSTWQIWRTSLRWMRCISIFSRSQCLQDHACKLSLREKARWLRLSALRRRETRESSVAANFGLNLDTINGHGIVMREPCRQSWYILWCLSITIAAGALRLLKWSRTSLGRDYVPSRRSNKWCAIVSGATSKSSMSDTCVLCDRSPHHEVRNWFTNDGIILLLRQ